MRRVLFILGFIVVFCGTALSQSVINMPFEQNPVLSVSSETVYLQLSGEKMQLGADLVITGGSGTYTYKWENADVVLGTEATIEITEGGTYILTITDTCDCSVEVSFIVKDAGVSELSELVFDVYPIPAKNYMTVEAKGAKRISQVAIVSMQGRVVSVSPEINASKTQIDVQDLVDGEYVLNCVYDDKTVETTTVIIRK